ncbi:MAG: globin [Planctomycetes bacterium]|nr:globin [Planctomycetota bacterium]MCB9905954.1 globin [Planctomycetota bacterium]
MSAGGGDPAAGLFERIGEERLRAVVAAFYRRVPEDDLLGPMYPDHDYAGAEERLADFLLYRLGGVPRYIETRGHPRLRMRHAPFPVDVAARDRWMRLMGDALTECEVEDPPRERLVAFLGDVATFLVNRR